MRVEAAGVRLEVRELGEGEPLVLLHGFTGSAAAWGPALPALASARRVIAPDLVGHGASEAPRDPAAYRVGAAVRQLLAMADALSIRRADWLGYSMGGRLALAVALAAPERVRSLVLESCGAGIEDRAERAARRKEDESLAQRIEREGTAAFVDHWLAQPLFATQRALGPAFLAAQRALRLGHAPHGLANALRGLGQGAAEPLEARLGEVRCAALLVSGGLDVRYADLMDRMAGAMPRARSVRIPGAGHAVHAERPEAFAREVLGFLDSTP